ncbi:MAG: DinB superfamily protein [Microgenomates bacterium OLB22]|nr:MAG: DinB superfamily protein [Microgenomates bacterium OLB22]
MPIEHTFLRTVLYATSSYARSLKMSQSRELAFLVGRLNRTHVELMDLLVTVPDEALNWRPCPGANSICAIVTHILGSEQYWIGTLAGRTGYVRDREAEFRALGTDAGVLVEEVRRVNVECTNILTKLDSATLDRMVSTTSGRRDLRYCINHAINHTLLHFGHLEITLQVWRHLLSQAQVR